MPNNLGLIPFNPQKITLPNTGPNTGFMPFSPGQENVNFGLSPITPGPITLQSSNNQWDMPENIWQSWFPASTYAKWGGWGGQEFELPQMKQVWWRSPDWGGGIVWHPYWGWQDRETIKNLYLQAQGPVTWEQFISWPLQRQLDQDWRKYFPDRSPEGGGTMPTGQTMGQWPMGYIEFNFPEYQLPEQMNVQYPALWQTAQDVLQGIMAGGGIPINVSPIISSLWDVTQRDLAKKLAQEREVAGLRGTQYSSPFMAAQTRNILDALSQWGLAGAQLQTQAQENALQRLLSATGQAAGLGSMIGQYPLQIAQQAMQMGQALNQPFLQALGMSYEDFLRLQQPSAWQQAVLGLATQQYPTYPAYKKGFGDFLSQLLGGLIGALPFIFLA